MMDAHSVGPAYSVDEVPAQQPFQRARRALPAVDDRDRVLRPVLVPSAQPPDGVEHLGEAHELLSTREQLGRVALAGVNAAGRAS